MEIDEAVGVLRGLVDQWAERPDSPDVPQCVAVGLAAVLLQAHERDQAEVARLREALAEAAEHIGMRGDRSGSEVDIRLAKRLREAISPRNEGAERTAQQ